MQGRGRDPLYTQRGQAIVVALVAVLLFGALAWVISEAQPGQNSVTADDGLQTATQVAAYPALVQSAAKALLASGIAVDNLDFQPDGKGKGAVFAAGSDLPYRSPAAVTGNKTEWSFKGISADGHGFYISGIGTDGPKGKDVVAVLDNLTKSVCGDINEALGLPRVPLLEIPAVQIEGKGGGPKDKAGKNAFSFDAHAADPKPGACVQNGDKYVYYRVIVAK